MDYEIVGDVSEIQNLFARDIGLDDEAQNQADGGHSDSVMAEGLQVSGSQVVGEAARGVAGSQVKGIKSAQHAFNAEGAKKRFDDGEAASKMWCKGSDADETSSEDTWPCSNCGKYRCHGLQV